MTHNKLKFKKATLADHDWDTIKQNVPTFMEHYINNIRTAHNNIQLTEQALIQSAFFAALNQYGIVSTDTESIDELKSILADYDIVDSPNVDWVYWVVYITTFIKAFITEQKKATPGIAGDAELAKDGYEFALSEYVPEEIKQASWFDELKQIIIDNTAVYGDVSKHEFTPYTPAPEESLQFKDTGDDGETEYAGGYQGEHAPEEGKEEEPDFARHIIDSLDFGKNQTKRDVRKLIDEYIDKMTDAQAIGDTERADFYKDQLRQISPLASKH